MKLRLGALALEPRMLYAGDLLDAAALARPSDGAAEPVDAPASPLRAEAHPADPRADSAAAGDPPNWPAAELAAPSARPELVIVDSRVPEAERLIDALRANAGARTIEIVALDPNRDGIEQIGTILAAHGPISALHLISRGTPGEIELGANGLNRDTLALRAGEIAGWRDALQSADLLVYGCNIAGDRDGVTLLLKLSALTGADVAASTDRTGAAMLGSNWRLEYQTGAIDAALLQPSDDEAWQHSLDAPPAAGQPLIVDTFNDSAISGAVDLFDWSKTIGADGKLSLREAVQFANARAGDDVIMLMPSNATTPLTYKLTISGTESAGAAGDLNVTDDLTIVGAGARTTIIDGNSTDRIFSVANGAKLTLQDLSLQNGQAPSGAPEGGAIATGGAARVDLNLIRVTVRNNRADAIVAGSGGGIYAKNADVTVTDSEFVSNLGRLNGGAIALVNSNLTVDGTLFYDNQADIQGGALWLDTNSTAELNNVTATGNHMTLNVAGGAVYTAGDLTITSSTFVGNDSNGAAEIYLSGGANARTTQSIFVTSPPDVLTAKVVEGSGNMASGGYNVFTANDVANSINRINLAAGDMYGANVQPMFALADNGGPTRTMAPNGGPAIVFGIPAGTPRSNPTDARGVAHPTSSIATIGAYEADVSTPIASPLFDNAAQLQIGTYLIGTAAELLAPSLQIIDPVGAQIISADLSISGGPAPSSESLTWLPSGLTATYTGGVLTISGAAGADTYETALRGVAYSATGTAAPHAVRVVTIHVNHSVGASSTFTVPITLDLAPVANPDSAGTLTGTAISIDALGNDTDPDADALTINQINGNPAVNTPIATTHGSVSFNTFTGQFDYSPAAGYTGSDSFTYQVSDGYGGTSTAVVTITITAPNLPPTAADDSITTAEDTALSFDVRLNDTDPNADPLTVTEINGTPVMIGSVVASAHGNIAFESDGRLRYTPQPDYFGADPFNYTVGDGRGGFAAATVNLTVTPVNDAPQAVADSAVTDQNSPIVIDVTANDLDVDGPTRQLNGISGVGGSAGGSAGSTVTTLRGRITVTATGKIDYTPNLNAFGSDSFNYSIDDGAGATDSASVTLTINHINQPPVAVADVAATMEDSSVEVDVLLNDSDSDGDPLTVVELNGVPVGAGSTIGIAEGTVTRGASNKLIFDPAPDFHGAASFSYTVSDGNGHRGSANVAVNVVSVNDQPLAVASNVTAIEDTARTLGAAEFGWTDSHDSPADGLAAVQITSFPGAGTLTLGAAPVTAGQWISAADLGAGKLVFAPAAAANGAGYASFAFRVQDTGGTANGGIDQSAASALMTINVTPVDDPPQITSPANMAVPENTTLVGTITATDIDSPAGALVYSLAPSADMGRFTLDPITHQLRFNAAPNFETPDDADGNDIWELTIRVDDGAGGTALQALRVAVLDVNDAPITANLQWTVPAIGTTSVGALLPFNFNDEDFGDDLSGIVITTLPAQGMLSLRGSPVVAGQIVSRAELSSGDLTFTTGAGASGPGYASVDFAVRDLAGLQSAPATVTVDTTWLPVITSNGGGANATVSVDENSTVVTSVTVTDADTPDSGLTYQLNGADAVLFKLDPLTHQLSFAVAPNFEAPLDADGDNHYDVVVVVNDPGSGSVAQSLDIAVANLNETPAVSVPAPQSVLENGVLDLSGAVQISDGDGDTTIVQLTLQVDHGTLRVATLPPFTLIGGGNGDAVMVLRAPVDRLNNLLATLNYTPDAGFVGADALVISVDDLGHSGAGAAIEANDLIKIDVVHLNTAPQISASQGLVLDAGGIATLDASTIVASDDTDPADRIAFEVSALPQHGALLRNGVVLGLNDRFTQADVMAGLVQYRHMPALPGGSLITDQFSVRAVDSAGASSADQPIGVSVRQPPPPSEPGTPPVPAPAPTPAPAPAPAPAPSEAPPTIDSGSSTATRALAAGASPAPAAAAPAQAAVAADSAVPVHSARRVDEAILQNTTAVDLLNRLDAPPSSRPFELPPTPAYASADAQAALALQQALSNQQLLGELDQARDKQQENVQLQRILAGGSATAIGTMSVGYVLWLLRGGVLLSGLLSALPAWQVLDPTPVLSAGATARGRRDDDDDADGDEIEHMFKEDPTKPEAVRIEHPVVGDGEPRAASQPTNQPTSGERR